MKRIFTSALALVLMIGAAQAQTKDVPRKKEGKEMAAKALNLTEAQKAELKRLREAEQKELKAIRDNGTLTQDQARTQRKAIQDKYRAQMQAILTPEQKAKAGEMKEKIKDRDNKGRRDRGAAAADQLNLTEEQRTKMASLRADFQKKREDIRNNNSLTQEQKEEQYKALAKDQKEQFKAVLTQEQIDKMKDKKGDRKGKGRKGKADKK